MTLLNVGANFQGSVYMRRITSKKKETRFDRDKGMWWYAIISCVLLALAMYLF